MGRIRTIKPEILEDDITAKLDHLEWRLFVSLFVIADDYGNLRGDPSYVHGAAFWASRESRETVAKALETLATVGLIQAYRVRGQSYLHIRGWSKHQKVDKPGKPRMPGPADSEAETFRGFAESSRDPRETLAESSRDSRETLATDHDHDLDPDHERDLARAHAIPPTTEPSTVVVAERERSALAERQKLRNEIWQRLTAARRDIAAELRLDVRGLAPQDEGERELADRLRGYGDDLARAAGDADHVLRARCAEARVSGSVQWLSGAMFTANAWRAALGMDPNRIGSARPSPHAHRDDDRPRSQLLTRPKKIA